MDTNRFLSELKGAVKEQFRSVNDPSQLFGFGISTDQDVRTIGVCYNTFEYFAESLKKRFLLDHHVALENRWIMAEWKGDIGYDTPILTRLNEEVDTYMDKCYESGDSDCQEKMLDLYFRCLIELREEGLFDGLDESFVLLVDASDRSMDQNVKVNLKKLLGSRFDNYEQEIKAYYID